MSDRFGKWFRGEIDYMENFLDAAECHDEPRQQIRRKTKDTVAKIRSRAEAQALINKERQGFYKGYTVVAIICCVLLIGVLLYIVANLPRYGAENPLTVEVVKRYVEEGLEETGAINIIAGLILDYRAFDTLGESHVLFTALICVTILMRVDQKNMNSIYEDFYTIKTERYFKTYKDAILRSVTKVLLPSTLLYGIYILLNGQNSPGGGFSGGTILGSAMIIYAMAYGFNEVDRVLTFRRISVMTFISLAFYSFAKGYVFITGANGLENHIPKGVPGAILSGGLILPLDIAVGLVVACTMFGFYSLFRRGSIGGD